MPVAGAGEVLIRVAASGVNRPDVLQRKGLYPVPPGASDLPGLEVAGTIAERRRRGAARGGLRASATASARSSPAAATPSTASRRSASACRRPANLSDIEAASLPETFFTVWSNVFDRGAPAAGRDAARARRLAAASASPRSSSPRRWGATVIVTVGSDEKAAACVAPRRRPRHQLQDAGLRRRGRCASPAARASTSCSTWSPATTSARDVQVPGRGRPHRHHRGAGRRRRAASTPSLVLRRRLTITGSTLRPRPVAFKSAIAASLKQDGLALARERHASSRSSTRCSRPPRRRAAHALMESNRHIGKLVLAW